MPVIVPQYILNNCLSEFHIFCTEVQSWRWVSQLRFPPNPLDIATYLYGYLEKDIKVVEKGHWLRKIKEILKGEENSNRAFIEAKLTYKAKISKRTGLYT